MLTPEQLGKAIQIYCRATGQDELEPGIELDRAIGTLQTPPYDWRRGFPGAREAKLIVDPESNKFGINLNQPVSYWNDDMITKDKELVAGVIKQFEEAGFVAEDYTVY